MQCKRSILILLILVVSAVALVGCAQKATPAPGTSTGTSITVTAAGMAFDTSTITVPAGKQIVITFINNDSGIPHNIAFYTSSAATTVIYRGARVTGVATVTYTFTAPSTPGTYFFRCDVHPATMTGTFIVQ